MAMLSAASPSLDSTGAAPSVAAQNPPPPKFYKLEFATYNGSTWYYALEQDKGMTPWEHFKELCRLRFGPPIHGSRLVELGRLPFVSTVQEFADRFQAVACHARDVSARQRAELFVGGLPDHIRVDVEMRDPPDLQTAMYYARAFERRAAAM
ncbi:uncharacterized protein [Miscanthus floridulus]|uniref:uncharacterized protein n=1 Tax=Miscanthus floridulus TaxID=154761 RepID=UPI00345ACDC8